MLENIDNKLKCHETEEVKNIVYFKHILILSFNHKVPL